MRSSSIAILNPNFFEQLDEDEEGNIEEAGDGEYIDEFWDVLADVRDFAIKKLERKFKAWFPYIDEDC